MSGGPLTIFLSAAEASGDLHASNLIRAIRAREPAARFVGAGGERMAAAGCELLADMTAKEGSGRNSALFGAARALGKYVNHKVLALGEVERALLEACKANGLIDADGADQCRKSLLSGLGGKALRDSLPALGFWGRTTR